MKPKPDINSKLMRPDEVALRLACTKRQVYYLIANGELSPALTIGKSNKKGIRVPESAVNDFIKRRMQEYVLNNGIGTNETS